MMDDSWFVIHIVASDAPRRCNQGVSDFAEDGLYFLAVTFSGECEIHA